MLKQNGEPRPYVKNKTPDLEGSEPGPVFQISFSVLAFLFSISVLGHSVYEQSTDVRKLVDGLLEPNRNNPQANQLTDLEKFPVAGGLGEFKGRDGKMCDYAEVFNQVFSQSRALKDLGLEPKPLSDQEVINVMNNFSLEDKVKRQISQGEMWVLPADPQNNPELYSKFKEALSQAIKGSDTPPKQPIQLYVSSFTHLSQHYLVISKLPKK
jgi:hypothetical protein